MFKNWEILKSDLPDKQEEYATVAEWCDKNNCHIELIDNCYYCVVDNPVIEQPEQSTNEVQ